MLALQTAGRRAVRRDSDSEYVKIVYGGSAHIVLAPWIGADDHIHNDNLAGSKKAVSPFCQF